MKTQEEINKRIEFLMKIRDITKKSEERRELTTEILGLRWVLN